MSLRTALLLCCAVALVLVAGCGGQGSLAPMISTKAVSLGSADYLQWDETKGNPVVAPSPDAAFPFVMYEAGQFLMWTANYASGGVRLRTSPDGKIWSAPVACTGLAPGARGIKVVRNASNQYEAWYWDASNDFDLSSFYHAVSSDGVTWTGNTRCFDSGSPHRLVWPGWWGGGAGSRGPCQVFLNASAPDVVDYDNVWQNRYVMYYQVMRMQDNADCIGVAVSRDGITWGVPVEGAVVLEPTPGSWDSAHASFASIFKDSNGFHMYYAGGRGWYRTGGEGIGYASSGDGLHWTKAAAPVVSIGDGVPWRSVYIGPSCALIADGVRRLFISASPDYTATHSVGLAMPDLTPPVIALSPPSDTLLSPANGRSVPLTFTGSALDAGVGVASATLTVEDEYGALNQTIDLSGQLDPSTGDFRQSVTLVASCNNTDADGHQYRLTLNAADARNNVASPMTVTVTAGKPNLQDNGGVGPGNGAGSGNGYGIGNGRGNGSKK